MYLTSIFDSSSYRSYTIQTLPSKSSSVFMLLDGLHRRVGDSTQTTFYVIASWICFLNVAWFVLGYVFAFFHPSLYFILFLLAIMWFYPSWIYRRLRSVYFHRHHIGGPYGWGTIDKHPSGYYCDL